MGFGEGKNDEMENGKLFIWFGKELQSGTLNEGEWAVLLIMEIKKKKVNQILWEVFSERGDGAFWKRFYFMKMFNRFFGKMGKCFEECEDWLAREGNVESTFILWGIRFST